MAGRSSSGVRGRATRPATRARTRKAGGASRGRLAPRGAGRGPELGEIALELAQPQVEPVAAQVRAAGGVPLGAYHEPLSGRPLLLATLPVAAVEPTPFQRDLSPTHARRLAEKIEETGAFLDPLIVVRGEEGSWWTPNGRHRLAAAKFLGLKQVTVLISPDEALAYRILALNTEKAHNLKDRSLEVIRMARSLARRDRTARESAHAQLFEAAELLTLGLAYEHNPRFAGGAYSSFLRKVDRFADQPLPKSLRAREGYAARLAAIDHEVKRIVAALGERGFKSPYLRNYVVARINPVRFHKTKKGSAQPAMPIAQALTRMNAAARRFDVRAVSHAELAWVAAGAESAE
ncbi:MAG TPA: ParB/RepB/Spo0J family partition protein [Steroidobacteraceae bacterium]|nr:ParB/RepB/Spo0J family partition protein [Steroidobacteraceae bacterium]